MSASGRTKFAVAASFLVYAIPVVTAHWADFLGVTLARELASDREAAWKASSLGLVLALQLSVFAATWILAGRGRFAAGAACLGLLVLLTPLANLLYLAVIPGWFLIEPDTTPDIAGWTEVCTVTGFGLDPVRAGVSRSLERRGETWVRSSDGRKYGILRVPGCTVEPAAIPDLPVAAGLMQAVDHGGMVYSTQERGSAVLSFWWLPRGARDGRRIEAPAGVRESERYPVVSEDGEWTAWIVRAEDRSASLSIQPADGSPPLNFTHPLLQQATVSLVELDRERREAVVNRGLNTFVCLRLDGSVAWGPVELPVAAQQDTFRRTGSGGWLAWDAYVEGTPYRLAWNTGGSSRVHPIPKGSVITSAALDARGRYVAVSTTTGLNIGSVSDRITVLRTATAEAVLRKTLPRYTRSPVAFLGGDYFAYSAIEGGQSAVKVLRVP